MMIYLTDTTIEGKCVTRAIINNVVITVPRCISKRVWYLYALYSIYNEVKG